MHERVANGTGEDREGQACLVLFFFSSWMIDDDEGGDENNFV